MKTYDYSRTFNRIVRLVGAPYENRVMYTTWQSAVGHTLRMDRHYRQHWRGVLSVEGHGSYGAAFNDVLTDWLYASGLVLPVAHPTQVRKLELLGEVRHFSIVGPAFCRVVPPTLRPFARDCFMGRLEPALFVDMLKHDTDILED